MTAIRTAFAVWEHDLLKGKGSVRGASGGLPETSVSWKARTEESGGMTSPEELLAAAHAACFAMALSSTLAKAGKPPDRLSVKASATFDKVGAGWKVTTMELDVTGTVPTMAGSEFDEAARTAEQGCPISNAIRGNVTVRLTSRLG